MQPSRLDLKCPRGDTLAFSFTVTLNDSPIDMSFQTGRLQVRANGSGNLLLDASTTGGEISTTTGGYVSIIISEDKTALIPVGEHDWALQFTQFNIVDTWLQGSYYSLPEMVRTT